MLRVDILKKARRKYHLAHKDEIQQKAQEWFDQRPDYKKDWHLKHRYGLAVGEYDRMLAAQDGKCKICRSADPGNKSGRFNVDHDHVTDEIRGLLCRSCNIGLGNFKDNADLLKAAIEYLGL